MKDIFETEEGIRVHYGKKHWIVTGAIWGAMMYIFNVIVFTFLMGDPLNWIKVLVGIPVWGFGGLIFGYIMHKIVIWKYEKK